LEAIVLLVSEFAEELIWAEMCLISFWAAIYGYNYIIKRREVVDPEWVPGAVVKDYLDRVRQSESSLRQQLFGEVAGNVVVQQTVGTDPALQQELEAVRRQLGVADQQNQEKDKIIAELKAGQGSGDGGGSNEEFTAAKSAWDKEKAELEKKLSDALAAGAASGGADPALKQELEDLKARLDEYEVIEDDLANLKKYQIENKQLKGKLTDAGISFDDVAVQAEAAAAAEEPAAEAPAAEAPAAEESAAEAPAAEESAAEEPAAEAPAAEEPAAEAPAAEEPAAEAPAAESTEDAPAAAAEGDEEKKAEKKEGGEDDLLSEFEKMLAS